MLTKQEKDEGLTIKNFVTFTTLKGFKARVEVGELHTPERDLMKLRDLILKYYDVFAWDQSEITIAKKL